MGDIKKVRRKYTGPSHPWQRDRIDREKITLKEYGFKNHTEIWKMISKLKNFKTQVKELATKSPTQRVLEEKQLLDRLFRLGLLNKDSTKEKVLDLTNEDFRFIRLFYSTQNKSWALEYHNGGKSEFYNLLSMPIGEIYGSFSLFNCA